MRSKEEVLELLNFLSQPETASYFIAHEVEDGVDAFLRLIYLTGFTFCIQFILDKELKSGDILASAKQLIAELEEQENTLEDMEKIVVNHKESHFHNKIFNAVQKPEDHPFTKVSH